MNTTPHDELQATLRNAARNEIAGTAGVPNLRDYLPEDVMPTPETLTAVYAITGASDHHRRQRAHRNFRMTPETESAWCRAALKRWAVINPATEPEAEPEPKRVRHAVALHFTMDADTDMETIKDQLSTLMQGFTGITSVDIVWLDREQFADELAAATKARDGHSNDEEIEALWEVVGSACGAYDVMEDDNEEEGERDQ